MTDKQFNSIFNKYGPEAEIRKIIRKFDFEKVHNVLTYIDNPEDPYVPPIKKMKLIAQFLLENALEEVEANKKNSRYCSEGFCADAWIENNKIHLQLNFILTSYNNFI